MNVAKLKNLLQKETVAEKTDAKESAVIIPLLMNKNDWVIIFEKKPGYDRLHPGQIAFPGGSKEDKDKTFLDTATRETYEEVGIQKQELSILGQEKPLCTLTTNFLIYPFVGVVKKQPPYTINRQEVEKLFFVPVKFLIKNPPRPNIYIYKKKPVETLMINFNKEAIWGATARILHNFIPKLQKACE